MTENVPVYETCEIQLARRPDNGLNLFIAEAISPEGPNVAGGSATFPPEDDLAKSSAHQDFIRYLTARRWEPVPDRGAWWWQNRFRRRWDTIEKAGDFSFLPRDDYLLVGETIDSAEMVVIPEGTGCTVVDINPDEGWVKFRLDDGRTAFMTEETDRRGTELSKTRLPSSLEILREGGDGRITGGAAGAGSLAYEYHSVNVQALIWNMGGKIDEIVGKMSEAGWQLVEQVELRASSPRLVREAQLTFRRVKREGNPSAPGRWMRLGVPASCHVLPNLDRNTNVRIVGSPLAPAPHRWSHHVTYQGRHETVFMPSHPAWSVSKRSFLSRSRLF